MASRKGSHIICTWPFLHFLTLQPAVAAKRLFQFKSDLEFECVSHLGHPNFPRQPPLLRKNYWTPKILFFDTFLCSHRRVYTKFFCSVTELDSPPRSEETVCTVSFFSAGRRNSWQLTNIVLAKRGSHMR